MTNKSITTVLLGAGLILALAIALLDILTSAPDWVMWALFVASGNLITTKVRHRNEVESISLVMAFILIAIQNLGWPEIVVATFVGVGLGEAFLTNRPWYKKLYNTAAVSLAGVLAEIAFTYSDIPITNTIIGTAIIFDIMLYLLLVPIWLWVAKQPVVEVADSYLNTMYVVPASALIAWTVITAVTVFGPTGVVLAAIATMLFIRPQYTIPAWAP